MLLWRIYQVVGLFIALMNCRNSTVYSRKLQTRQTSNRCPDNNEWKFFKDLCFILIRKATVYSEGRRQCKLKSSNAYLAKVRSKEDYDFLKKTFNFNGFYWIGLTKKRLWWSDGVIWEDGTQVKYINWESSTEPTDNGRENCAMMHTTGRYYDVRCGTTHQSFCSVAAKPPVTTTTRLTTRRRTKPKSKSTLFGSIGGVSGLLIIVFGLIACKKCSNQNNDAFGSYGNYGNYGAPPIQYQY